MSSGVKKDSEIESFIINDSSWTRFYYHDSNKTCFTTSNKISKMIRFDGYVTADKFIGLKAFW